MRTIARWIIVMGLIALTAGGAWAHCPVKTVTSGLLLPTGITRSNWGNLLVAENGTREPNTGRISIVGRHGHRRTLLEGLPSGIADVGEVSGPAGVFMRDRTLYVAIGVGDAGIAGPIPGTTIPNPEPISSPIFSSVLAIHFSAWVEFATEGFTLTADDHHALASGVKLALSNGRHDKITVELIADFPDYAPNPIPPVPANIRLSNPFDLVALEEKLYVTDGGQNLLRQVDLSTGTFSTLTTFPNVPNPLFNPMPPPPSLGGPFVEAVPTGIRILPGRHSNFEDAEDDDAQLLVTVFRGFPFPEGSSVVEEIDPATGAHTPLITGLKTAIDVLPIRERHDTDYLVLQHASGPGLFNVPAPPPGLLLRFDTPGHPPTTVTDCLTRPTSMTFDRWTDTLYVTELGGRLVAIPVP
jgi:hypothetical protein